MELQFCTGASPAIGSKCGVDIDAALSYQETSPSSVGPADSLAYASRKEARK